MVASSILLVFNIIVQELFVKYICTCVSADLWKSFASQPAKSH